MATKPEQESSVKVKNDDDDTKVKAVVKALLSAVEEQGGIDDADADESSETNNNTYSCKPLLQVFQSSSSKKLASSGLYPKQRQSLILDMIQSSSFSKESRKEIFLRGEIHSRKCHFGGSIRSRICLSTRRKMSAAAAAELLQRRRLCLMKS
jgi:hypothetical protein